MYSSNQLKKVVRLLPVLAALLLFFPGGRSVVAKGPAEPVPAPDPAGQFPALANNHHYQASAWALSLRASPGSDIPQGARQRALQQTRQADSAQRAAPAGVASAATASWVNVGAAPLADGQIGTITHTRPMSGRVSTLAVDPGNSSHWLAGAAQGGIWSTTDAGTTWTPLTDAEASLASGAIAFAPAQPQTIYAGTGEKSFSGDGYAGAGILKSTDGGSTWALIGDTSFAGTSIGGLVVGTDPNVVLAGNMRGIAGFRTDYTPGPHTYGIYRSDDGGATWSLKKAGQITDLKVDPTDFSHQIAGIGEPFGDTANGVYRSLDSGATWSLVMGPWASTQPRIGRVELATSTSSPSTAYVSIGDSFGGGGVGGGLFGLWRTDNMWAPTPTWTLISVAATDDGTGAHGYCGWDRAFARAADQCWYSHVITVDPTNASVIYAGGIPVWKYDGTTWTEVSKTLADPANGIHADQHAAVWAGSRLIVGNDGGVWSTTDGGATWADHNTNLSIAQYYYGSVHPSNLSAAIAGAQDNGTQQWTGTPSWSSIFGGDGTTNAISRSSPDSNWMFSSQNHNFQRTKDGGTSFTAASAGILGTRQFVPAAAECPTNEDVFITGTSQMNRSNNFFSSTGSPTWTQDSATGYFSGITTVAFAPSDATCNTYAFGSKGGSLAITTDGGTTYTSMSSGGVIPLRAMSAMAFDPSNANTLYVTVSGFNISTLLTPGHVFKTTNALAATPVWTDISPPVDLPLNALVVDPAAPQTLYAGSDIGVWVSADGGASWSHFGPAEGMPNVAVFDLKLSPGAGAGVSAPARGSALAAASNQLMAFTHGRGAFTLALGTVVPAAATLTSPVNGTTFTSASQAFSWTTAAGADTYSLWVGSTVGGYDLYFTYCTCTTTTATGLPTNGSPLFVRLWTHFASGWLFNDYSFTAVSYAVITSPTPGSTLSGASVPFSWTSAAAADQYALWVGSSVGGYDYYYVYCVCTSTTATGLPTNSSTVYVRLWTSTPADGWTFTDYTYVAAAAP